MPDFKKGAITTKLWLRSFFTICYPTGEGEQGLLKIADTRYFAMRGEPTTKYSGWGARACRIFLTASEKASCRISKKTAAIAFAIAAVFC